MRSVALLSMRIYGSNVALVSAHVLVYVVRVAYADPPYLGCCVLYGHEHGDDGLCWNEPETHRALMSRLVTEFPDGWALSCSTPSLRVLLPMAPEDVRVAAWVKPFAAFKPNVNPAYAWEPVIWRGGRTNRDRRERTVRDWHSENITLRRGLCGAKPEGFVVWLFDLLGVQESDEVVDIFPGTGVVTRAREHWRRYRLALESPQSRLDDSDDVAAALRGRAAVADNHGRGRDL